MEELLLWLTRRHPNDQPPAPGIPAPLLSRAAGLPRLRLVEARAGDEVGVEDTVLYEAKRREGETAEAMLQRLVWDLARAAVH